MTAQKKPGGHWSEANPVPTIQQFVQELDAGKKERDARIDEEEKQKKQQQKQKPEEQRSEIIPHRAPIASKTQTRKVTDPTTGSEVEIDDVGKDFMKAVKEPHLSVPNANLGLPTPIKSLPTQSLEEYKEAQDVTAPPDPIASGTTSDVPIHGERTNILFHPTPSISYEPMFKALERHAGILCAGIFGAILIVGRLSGGALKWILPLSCCVASAVWLWAMNVIRRGRAGEWHSEKLRGQTATANLIPESVEWMNSFLGIAWGLVNPDMFASVADTIEDIMHASLPAIIENVRISEIDQGSNPFRIISMRSLPNNEVPDLVNGLRKHNEETKGAQEAAADDEGGEPYNLECSFAYHSKPTGVSTAGKAQNMHMMVVFYLGIKGLFGVPLPIFVELNEVVGTIRLRLQLTPQPPFAKSLTFSLMGMPHIRAGCTPMVKRGVNILNLPLISNFVNYAIGAAAGMYVAPKSMSLDLGMMLGGDDIQKDTLAMGVLWVRIHRATGLSKQDARGSEGGGSDPYINLSFSKYGKPMYCTRVICDDLNPVWEEASALLVNPELLKADEQLSIELWDSDRNTADDIVGKVEVSVQKLVQRPGKMFSMVSKLSGMDADSEMPGELYWEVGYFPKPKFRRALRTDGKDHSLPKSIQDDPALQDEKGNIDSPDDDAVVHTPPDPLWPSGICTIVVHQIVNLQKEDIQGSEGDRKGKEYEPARAYGESMEEEGKDLPTSYCKITLNDEPVYRTRAKAVSSKPIFNAGTERFVRDWRSAIVTITVRDQRHREHDPILGIVPLKLSDILQTSSQATRWYPLDGGIGFGRIRVSLLFRSVEIKLPPRMLGYDVGSFQLMSEKITVTGYQCNSKIKLRTSGSHTTIPRSAYTQKTSGDKKGGNFDISSEEMKDKTLLPIKHRYRSAVIFELQESTPIYGIVWLHELVDNEVTSLDIPLWKTKNAQRLTQNYITEDNLEDKKSTGFEDLRIVGRLQFTCRFAPGFHRCHERTISDNNSRESFETWEACVAEGVRGEVRVEVPPTIRSLHEKSLSQERDILRQSNAGSEKKSRKTDNTTLAFPDSPQPAILDRTDNVADNNPGTKRRSKRLSNASGAAHSTNSGGSNRRSVHDQRTNNSINHRVSGSGTIPTDPANTSNNPSDPTKPHEANHEQDTERIDNNNNEEHENEGIYEHQGSYSDSEIDSDDIIADGQQRRRSEETAEERKRRIGNKANKRSERRKQRGVMQWLPARNAAFAKHEATFAIRKVKNRFMGDMTGREPDIQTEVA